MTCTSLPNLSQYGNHQICASQDVISSKSPIQASFNMDLDLPGICDAHGERLKTMPPSNINLPVLKDQTETLVRSENELSKVSYNDLALPINNAQIADDEARKTQDKSGSNLAPEIINIQTDTIRFNNFNNFSASQVELPTISEPLLGVAVQKTSLGNIKTNNSYLSVVGFHKIDVVKSLPSIKILDEDNARDRQQSGKPEISKTKITITEPGRKLFLENQGFELKTQKSQIQTKPDADGLHISADEVNQLAAMSSSLSNSLVGVIPNHGEVTSRENKSLHPQECPNPFKVSSTSLDTQTLLTTSVSYSNSFQDGEEVSDWPKVAYLIKHSSTISLSSNFDILNHQLVTHSNPKHDHLYDVSNKSNTELSNDKMTYKREVIMNKQSCDIADHKNMVVEGLSFNCAFLQQNNMKTEEIKSLIGMENETFYTEDGSQHCGNLIDEEATLRIHNTQGTVRDQVDMNLHFFKYAEQAHIQMENSERMKVTSHNLDSHINNGGTVIYKSNEDNKQTSNVDLVVNSRADIQTRSEEPCRSQTGEVENIKEQTVIHKGDHLKSHFNNRHLKEYKRQEYLSKDFTCPPDAKIQTSKDEDPLSQTKILNNKTCSDLTTSDITDERIDFSINSKLSIEDGNHVAENVKDVSNIFQDILGADSISASEEICALAGSKRKSILGPEILPNDLKINYESDDSRESNYNLKENYCNYDESVDDLRKAPVDVPNCIPVCNSDVTFNTGQANSVDSMDILLCNTETTLKTNQQPLDQHKNPKTHSKQMWSNQKCKTNSSLKTATASDKFYLKDYLSNRIYRRPFNSVFTFSTKTSTEEGEGIGKATLEGEPSANNSVTAKPLLLLSDGYTETKKLEAVEYLTYLYSRSPKPKANVSDIDDISVLANLNFCKVALPEEFAKQKMSADVEEYEHPNVEPADPGRVYVPPSKEELKADDELAVLHVMYNLKKSLELSHNKDTETD
ncbi:uncharacterized protein [Pyxicephalus adspersus]|uniref:uncharacterized protein isoform X1 n=1 Tax=Pyxicephalus adspersus TaxID=30357 RepID=UPI003B58C326